MRILGYRIWTVQDDKLMAVGYDVAWNPGLNIAVCHCDRFPYGNPANHEQARVATLGVRCGIWAHSTAKGAVRHSLESAPRSYAIGVVALSGNIVRHALGMRAAKAEILGLTHTPYIPNMEGIADRYGVPLVGINDLHIVGREHAIEYDEYIEQFKPEKEMKSQEIQLDVLHQYAQTLNGWAMSPTLSAYYGAVLSAPPTVPLDSLKESRDHLMELANLGPDELDYSAVIELAKRSKIVDVKPTLKKRFWKKRYTNVHFQSGTIYSVRILK